MLINAKNALGLQYSGVDGSQLELIVYIMYCCSGIDRDRAVSSAHDATKWWVYTSL